MTFSKHSNPWRKFVVAGLLGLPLTAMADWGLNLTRGVTPYSNTVYNLHMLILTLCIVIGVVVFGVMFYSIFAFRKSVVK